MLHIEEIVSSSLTWFVPSLMIARDSKWIGVRAVSLLIRHVTEGKMNSGVRTNLVFQK